jgi:hypothetical protein
LLEDSPEPKLPHFGEPEPKMRGVKISPIMFVFGIGALLVAGIAAYMTFGPKPAPPPEPVLTQEARQYLPNLNLEGVHMQASESFTNQRVIEILGNITNKGNRTVSQALVTCVFYDFAGQIVARENDYIVGGTAGSLPPGGTKPFRLAFDTIPDSWTQALPTLVIREIKFQ